MLLTDATAINVGTGAVSAVYVGSTQVWAPPVVGFGAFNPATLDAFSRAQGALGANWVTPWLNATGTISISSTSGRTSGSLSGANSSITGWTTQIAENQDVALTIPVVDSTSGIFVQIVARASTIANNSTTSEYLLRVTPNTSTFNIRKVLNGGSSSSLASFTQAITTGGAIGLRVTGNTTTTLTAYHKPSGGSWTQVGTIDDTSSPITGAGYIGFALQGTIVRGGTFAGGAVT